MRHKVPHFTSKPLLLPLPGGTLFSAPEGVRGLGGWAAPQYANSILRERGRGEGRHCRAERQNLPLKSAGGKL